MTTTIPLTDDERALLVSSPLTRTELAERFGCSVCTIKRVRQRIRAGERDVYLVQPPLLGRPKPERKHFRKSDGAAPRELEEGPLGWNTAAACEDHLVDLKRWHEPLPSLRVTVQRRWRA